jgi:hypothetical protein
MKRLSLSGHNCSESFTFHTSFLADDQIIDLHKAMLTNGFHHMHVSSIQEGRAILHLLLDALDYYHDIACLSMNTLPLKPAIFDLHYYLQQGGYLDQKYKDDLEDFFLQRFDHDFLWIELTEELINKPWFCYFEQKLIDLRIQERIPIMVVSSLYKK